MNKPISPMKAIRLKCLDCCCNSPYEVKLCPSVDCPIYPFRLGKNPYRTPRVLSDEQKAKLIKTLATNREKKRGNADGTI